MRRFLFDEDYLPEDENEYEGSYDEDYDYEDDKWSDYGFSVEDPHDPDY